LEKKRLSALELRFWENVGKGSTGLGLEKKEAGLNNFWLWESSMETECGRVSRLRGARKDPCHSKRGTEPILRKKERSGTNILFKESLPATC